MDILLQKIDILKNKIIVAIESFGFYSEFKYIKDILYNELKNYKYDLNDEMSLKKYYAWLQEFYEGRIELINKTIADNNNNSVFDNSTNDQLKEIEKYKKEIELLLEYIKDNYPQFANCIIESYKNLNKYYEEQYKYILENSKKKINIDLGINKEPALSLYQDAYSLIRSYITKLEIFNSSCSNIKRFAENDTKIKEIFKRSYETFIDSSITEMINKIEKNYKQSIEISIENGFSLEGIESIQENVLNQCSKLDELITKENKKTDYHNKIQNMTLNIEFDKLIEIINYVEINNIFKEELLNNLYALVEQEKYLLKKYYYEPRIYNALSEKIKIELEKEFISRLSEYKEDETSQTIDRLKKYGYLNTFDKKYYDYYNKQSYINNIELDIKEPKYKIINYIYKDRYYESLSNRWHFILVISNRKDLQLLSKNSPIYKSDIIFSKYNTQCINETHDYIILGYGKDDIKEVIINLKTGKGTKTKKGMCEQVFDFIIGYDKKSKKIFVYDSNYKLVQTIDNYDEINVDYRKEQFLITKDDKPEINIYDKDFNYVKEIKIPIDYTYIINANDGVVTLRCPNDGIIYYDYINMKVIDSFKCEETLYSKLKNQYVYSDGVYSYIDKNGYKGYKDLDGNIVLEPKYEYASAFMGNVALVIKNNHKGIIDKTGKFYPIKEVYEELYQKKENLYKSKTINPFRIDLGNSLEYLGNTFWGYKPASLKPDFAENRYKFISSEFYTNQNRGHLVTTNHYKINVDEPIMNIDFTSKSHQKELNKTL